MWADNVFFADQGRALDRMLLAQAVLAGCI
jgi:hypothetical protein